MGPGAQYWLCGAQIRGEPLPHGRGMLMIRQGAWRGDAYRGDVNEGIPDGHGLYVHAQGDIYNGSWVRVPTLLAIAAPWAAPCVSLLSSAVYHCYPVARQVHGMKHGQGFYRWSDGAQYVLRFTTDLRFTAQVKMTHTSTYRSTAERSAVVSHASVDSPSMALW